jgi:hypothetical protein
MPIHIGKIANGEASFQALFLKDAKNLGSQSMVGRVVIDTGAMATVINSQIANDLKLTAVDVREVYARHVTIHPDRIPVNSTLAGEYHTNPNFGSYRDTTGEAHSFVPRQWSRGDAGVRTSLIQNYPLLSFVLGIEAVYNNSLFGLGSPSFDTDEWPSWAGAPNKWPIE